MNMKARLALALAAIGMAVAMPCAHAQKKYDPGASDTEIRVGQTMPYSGPASAYGTIGRVQAAYFKKVNDEGGINGRKINFVSVDDGYNPSKTVEAVRQLVERDEVLLVFSPVGTAPNVAIHKYLNSKKVPHLFVSSGATRWNDPANLPWTMGWQVNYQTEAALYARHILQTVANARIAVLYQNDDYGRDYLKGLKDGLGDKASAIVGEASYEISDATVDSQIVQLQATGANVFVNITTPKFAAQAIRKAHDTGWRPIQYLNIPSQSVVSVLTPAGLDKSTGILSSAYFKDPTDPQWADDAGLKEWAAFMKRYDPQDSASDSLNLYGYMVAQTLVQVLRQCGDNLTRENVMKQAANLKDLQLGGLLPGVKINTGPTDHAPVEALQMTRFDGKAWARFGAVVGR